MTTLTKGEKSTVTITGEIATELFEKQRAKAVHHIAETVHIDGFRKFGEGALLEEMAHRALEKMYPEIIEEHEIEAIGRPEISITKLEKGAPVGFTVKTAVMPMVTLPDYKKIAKERLLANTESSDATEKEVDDVVAEIKKLRTKEGEEAPELTDEYVKTLGNFENVADFTGKIRKNISLEKEIKLRDKKRVAILEGILETSTSELPDVLVDTELERMVSQMKADIVRAGGTFEGYVESTGKTEEDIRREMREAAEKRVRFELILKQIGKKEKLEASPEEVEKETAEVMAHYQGADPERAQLYVEGMLLNEKVLQFLETQK